MKIFSLDSRLRGNDDNEDKSLSIIDHAMEHMGRFHCFESVLKTLTSARRNESYLEAEKRAQRLIAYYIRYAVRVASKPDSRLSLHPRGIGDSVGYRRTRAARTTNLARHAPLIQALSSRMPRYASIRPGSLRASAASPCHTARPDSSTQAWSAMSRARWVLCSTSSTVMPRDLSLAMA